MGRNGFACLVVEIPHIDAKSVTKSHQKNLKEKMQEFSTARNYNIVR
jgi:hypothetical protein